MTNIKRQLRNITLVYKNGLLTHSNRIARFEHNV